MPERLAPNPWLTKWTHDEIDAGADIIVMHGAPLLHGVEIYRGRPIFYDLGNFIYNVPPTLTYIDEPMAWESVVATVQFEGGTQSASQRPAQRSLKSISFRPVVLNNIGDGQPDVHERVRQQPVPAHARLAHPGDRRPERATSSSACPTRRSRSGRRWRSGETATIAVTGK